MIESEESKVQTHIQNILNDLEDFRGRIYFDVSLMDDDLLTMLVSSRIIKKSSGYIEDLARSMSINPAEIIEPTPYTIARIAEVFTFREAALKRTHGNEKGDENGADKYERKRQIYQKELERLIAKITEDTFIGGQAAKARAFPMSVPLYRG